MTFDTDMPQDNEEDLYVCCPSHCCKEHGCKYSLDGCPVATGKIEAVYSCEQCGLEMEGYYGFDLFEKDLNILKEIVKITGAKPREQLRIILKEYLEKIK